MEKPKWVVLYNLLNSRHRVFFNNEVDAQLLFNKMSEVDSILEALSSSPKFVPTKRPFDKSDWAFL